jgi:hypothetical protein
MLYLKFDKFMKKSSLYLLILLTVIVSSCNSPQSSSEAVAEEPKSEGEIQDELYQEVIAVHDVAMLKMQTIMNLKTKAIQEADSLRELADDSIAERIEALEKLQEDLEGANKSMMVWMRAFRPVSDTTSYEQAMDYLRSEQDKIAEVDSQMDKAIEAAKSL